VLLKNRLFTVVNGTSSNVKNYIETEEEKKYRNLNNENIHSHLRDFNEDLDMIIAAWGSYYGLLESK
jgi:hypothetical protein